MIVEVLPRISVFQFGVGGNGSWLVGPLCKFFNSILQRYGEDTCEIKYYIIDDDTVEDRNILRQNFEPHDIGRRKITAMLRRYFHTYNKLKGIDFRPDTKRKLEKIILGTERYPGFPIILGCSDNNKTRRAIFNLLNKTDKNQLLEWEGVIYLDAGNNLENGQITTCAWFSNEFYTSEEDWRIFRNERRFKNPPFLKMFPSKDDNDPDDQGCAFYGDQSLTINMLAATQMFANMQTLFINGVIPPNVKHFNSMGYSTFEI